MAKSTFFKVHSLHVTLSYCIKKKSCSGFCHQALSRDISSTGTIVLHGNERVFEHVKQWVGVCMLLVLGSLRVLVIFICYKAVNIVILYMSFR